MICFLYSPGVCRSITHYRERSKAFRMVHNPRVLIIQYCGDYREAFNRFSQGGAETYHAQKYSINTIAELAQKVDEIAVLACVTDEAYNEVLPNQVRAIGGGYGSEIPVKELLCLVEQQNPTHLIINVPIRGLFQWANRHQVRTLALLADSFSTNRLIDRLRNYLLARLLNQKQIEWIANHNINSSRSLQRIGVNPDKIIPWDWEPAVTPEGFLPKQLQPDKENFQLVYVGSIIESKGVGDILAAVSKLKSKNLPITLKMAGKGEISYYQEQAKQLDLDRQVEFLGLVPNNEVVPLMREADLVIIPSRHDYPEGLPMTIYEALCSYTPIVASDHPMFEGNLVDHDNALVFPAGDSSALAERVENLLSNPELYQQLSSNSKDAWERLQIPVKFAELLNRWIFDTPENRQWLFDHRLASGRYD